MKAVLILGLLAATLALIDSAPAPPDKHVNVPGVTAEEHNQDQSHEGHDDEEDYDDHADHADHEDHESHESDADTANIDPNQDASEEAPVPAVERAKRQYYDHSHCYWNHCHDYYSDGHSHTRRTWGFGLFG